MSQHPLPDWVKDSQRTAVYTKDGAYSPATDQYCQRSTHPIYQRQLFPERLPMEISATRHIIREGDYSTLWHSGDDFAILSFKTKMHTVNMGVLEAILDAVKEAENHYKALIIWQDDSPFCAGANLLQVINAIEKDDFDSLAHVVRTFQLATMALKHSRIPTIAAVSGLALGGGCEIILHCDRAVVAMESYIGLVEVGVGLIPGAGGLKEMALRAADDAKGGDVFPGIARIFEQIAMGKVSASALEARNMGYLRPSDPIIMHPQELLYVAKQQAHALYESGYTPPLQKKDIPIAGRDATATLQARMLNMLEGGFISEYDFDIGSRLATTLCGGELAPNTPVSDEWLLKLEHTHFMTLSHHAKTQARIRYMLDKGKPLRN
jgi:3-hydroxyacyl-CoA dehydrogenase